MTHLSRKTRGITARNPHARDGIWPFRDAEIIRAQEVACDATRHLALNEVLEQERMRHETKNRD